MDTLEAIKSRRSIREFESREIPKEDIKSILLAGLEGPSCVNSKDYALIMLDDRDLLERVADGNGYAASCLKQAQFGVLVCGDLSKSYEKAPNYWIIDASIVVQNMILAATSLGVGSCWLGTYPQESKMQAQREIFNLPDHIVPHSIVAFGYPTEEQLLLKKKYPKDYSNDCIHFNKW